MNIDPVFEIITPKKCGKKAWPDLIWLVSLIPAENFPGQADQIKRSACFFCPDEMRRRSVLK